MGNERRWISDDRRNVNGADVCGQSTLRVLLPRGDGPLQFGRFTEDKTEEDIQATDGEKEECGDERKGVDMMGEDSGSKEHLEETEGTQTELISKNWEELVEEFGRESELGQDQDGRLENDKEAVEDGPEGTGRLVGDSAAKDVVHVFHQDNRCTINGRLVSSGSFAFHNEFVDGFDVIHKRHNVAREYEQQCDDTENANTIETNEDIGTRRKHCRR